MSTFPYALPKLLVLNGTVKTTGTSAALTAGDFGIYDKNDHTVVTTGNVASHPYVYMAQGSYFTVDHVGNTPLQGLQESVKTVGINAGYVSKFYKITHKVAKNYILQIGGTSALNFESDKTYRLRVEAKGAEILHSLNRHLYYNVPYFTGCPSSDCLTGCDKEYVDPASVMLGWADYITANPLLSTFVRAQAFKPTADTGITATYVEGATTALLSADPAVAVGKYIIGAGINAKITAYNTGTNVATLDTAVVTSGTAAAVVIATLLDSTYTPTANSTTAFTTLPFLVLTAAYTDTVFGDCSFNPYDFYQTEPILLYAALVNEDGDPCSTGPVINSNVGTNTTIIQDPVQPQGVGETVIRDYLKSREYMNIHFATDPRRREIEKDPVFTVVNRAHYFDRYYLQFSVPVKTNFTNTFSSNQYLVGFAFDAANSASTFETLVAAWLAANNPSVSLKTY